MVPDGMVFAVEISPRAMKDLIRVSIPRRNLIPILADAMDPGSYKNMVTEVDILYQDIAQRDQASIAIRNAQFFLKKNGILVLIIKAKSIDSIKKPKDLIGKEIEKLEDLFKVEEYSILNHSIQIIWLSWRERFAKIRTEKTMQNI